MVLCRWEVEGGPSEWVDGYFAGVGGSFILAGYFNVSLKYF